MNCNIFKEWCFSYFILLYFIIIKVLVYLMNCLSNLMIRHAFFFFFFFSSRVYMAYLCMENSFTIKLFESNHFNNLQRNYGHIGWFNVNKLLDALCSRCSQVSSGWIYAWLAIDPIGSGGEKLDLAPIGKGN